MRYLLCFVALFFFGVLATAGDKDIIKRGDANNDGTVDLSDAIYISNWLNQGGPAPPCANQADVDDNGIITTADISYLILWYSYGEFTIPAPGPWATECSEETGLYPGCNTSPCD